jgi:hypothetical protein
MTGLSRRMSRKPQGGGKGERAVVLWLCIHPALYGQEIDKEV